jgi:hypothetical protein
MLGGASVLHDSEILQVCAGAVSGIAFAEQMGGFSTLLPRCLARILSACHGQASLGDRFRYHRAPCGPAQSIRLTGVDEPAAPGNPRGEGNLSRALFAWWFAWKAVSGDQQLAHPSHAQNSRQQELPCFIEPVANLVDPG